MRYLKCGRCRIRLDRTGPEVHLFDRRCPICGSALEPVAELSDLVGFRSFDLADGEEEFAAAPSPQQRRSRSLRAVRETMSTRDAALWPLPKR